MACTQSGGAKRNSTQKASADHDRAKHQDHADRGAVAGIVRAQVEAADVAAVAHLEQVTEQLASTATRAAAGQCDVQRAKAPAAPPRPQRDATTGLAPHQ